MNKTFFIVRHAESVGNVAKVSQGHAGGLSPRGKVQARALAGRLAAMVPERIIASPYDRTNETALAISEATGLPVTYSDLLIERRHPSELVGIPVDAERSSLVRAIVQERFGESVRHSDEEGFPELRDRSRSALKELLALPEERIVVVTHGAFLSILTAAMLHGERLTPEIADAHQTRFANASLSIFEHRERRTWMRSAEVGWIIERLNDISHLE